MKEVVDLLKKKGYNLIPISIPRVEEITQIMVSLTVAEGGLEGYEEILEGEPLGKEY